MFKKEKTIEILKGRELLRINSLHKPVSKSNRNARIITVTLFFSIFMAYFYFISVGLPNDFLWGIWGILAMLYGLVLFLIIFLRSTLGSPLIITERGIAGPNVAELWEDIENYSWENFKGATKVLGPTVFSACEGVCLRIKNKGIFPRTIDGKGHTILAQYLIFFSPEQIAEAEHIFNQHGIKKA